MDALLGTCSLTELRQRKSVKWREYPPEVLPAFVAEMDFSLAEPVIAAVASALAIGDSGYAHPGQLPDAFAQNRALLAGLLAEHLPGVRYAPPQSSFLAWLDCRDLGLGEDPAAMFHEKGKVALAHGPEFGAEGHGFARLNMGTSPELLGEAVRRMASAL